MAGRKPSQVGLGDHERYKTALCLHWSRTGRCEFGNKCHFAHGPDELRERPQNARLGPLGKLAERHAHSAAQHPHFQDPPGLPHAPGEHHSRRPKFVEADDGWTVVGAGGHHGFAAENLGPPEGRGKGAPVANPRPAATQLSEAVLSLMKEHKRRCCVSTLQEMGFTSKDAEWAAGAAGCDNSKAVQLLTEGSSMVGWRGQVMAPKPVDVSREAKEAIAAACALGFTLDELELEIVMASGNWETAGELLEARAISRQHAKPTTHLPPTIGAKHVPSHPAPQPPAVFQLPTSSDPDFNPDEWTPIYYDGDTSHLQAPTPPTIHSYPATASPTPATAPGWGGALAGLSPVKMAPPPPLAPPAAFHSASQQAAKGATVAESEEAELQDMLRLLCT